MARKDAFTIRVDTNIGKRIHELRLAQGLSRQQLVSKIGITHQQLQKYEKGANRVSCGRIAAIAQVLGKSVAYFFEGVYDDTIEIPTQHQRMCIEIGRNFLRIKNPKHQDLANEVVRRLSGD